ncbi:ArsR/SmtB family transcription factor [Sphingomonas sp. LT1P40]|uniref:ArsR/SmtB family transcription factor n=1 Tax=Alteristakelama amylovorans TaxID=3096166 RepID=UPI002FC7067A
MPFVARFSHPRLDDVPLTAVLHALGDPVRLGIVARLAMGAAMNCTTACPGEAVPKSTLSNHLRILREAGLIETVQSGRDGLNSLRREAFDARFPGLLDSVLAQQCGGARPA